MKKSTLLFIFYLFILSNNNAQTGYLDVKSQPPNAEVYLNNIFKGKTPSLIELRQGTYSLRLVINGYEDFNKQIKIASDLVLRENANLKIASNINDNARNIKRNENKDDKKSTDNVSMVYPIAQIAGKTNGIIKKNALLVAGAIIPENVESDVYYKVKSYTFSVLINGDTISRNVNGNLFSQEVINMIEHAFPGQHILFNNIEVEGPNRKRRIVNEISFELPKKTKKKNDAPVFAVVESMPEFPGGMTELRKYLANNIVYPVSAKNKGIQGRVFVNFIVEVDGSISNIKVLRGLGGRFDKEAVRIIRSMPNWKPGMQRGKPVRTSFNLPIKFILQ